MRSSCVARLALAGAVLLAAEGGARAQEEEISSEPPPLVESAPLHQHHKAYDPFADSLFVLRAPAGFGLGLVYTTVEQRVVVASETYDAYAATIDDAEIQRSASLVALPIGRGMMVTGDLRYVRLVSPMDVGRAPLWNWVAYRGGSIGVVGAF